MFSGETGCRFAFLLRFHENVRFTCARGITTQVVAYSFLRLFRGLEPNIGQDFANFPVNTSVGKPQKEEFQACRCCFRKTQNIITALSEKPEHQDSAVLNGDRFRAGVSRFKSKLSSKDLENEKDEQKRVAAGRDAHLEFPRFSVSYNYSFKERHFYNIIVKPGW